VPDRQKTPRRRANAAADQPHAFEEIADRGFAAWVGSLGRQLGRLGWAVMTSDYIRDSGCAVCRRPRQDPIHQVDG